jgi:GntR family transcriptional regulator/MocR family aminotransferase
VRFREPLHHGIHIDRRSGRSLHDQLVDELRRLIGSGALAPGTRVPSTRTLADALQISRSVAQSAFLSLHAEGLLASRHGSGSYVRGQPGASQPGDARPDGGAPTAVPCWADFATEQPNLEVFPRVAWRSAWRRACHQVPAGRQAPLGERELRAAIAEHLRSTRGIVCEARQVLVCAGRRGALDVVAHLLALAGGAVAVDDPGSPPVRRALRSRGARVLPAAVDADGIRPPAVDPATARGARARHLVTCPGHQVPLGIRMPARRRAEIVQWARARGGVIVEDDQHGGLCGAPNVVPPLFATVTSAAGASAAGTTSAGTASAGATSAGTASPGRGADLDRMVYVGSLGALLTPTLQVDYLVLTERLRREWTGLLAEVAAPPPWMDQQAALYLLAEGQVARQVRQVQVAYRRKREIVRAELAAVAGTVAGVEPVGVELAGVAAGTHACLLLPPGVVAAALGAELARLGVSVPTLASFASRGDGWGGRDGLVLGYGHLPDATLRRALHVIVDQLARHVVRPGRTSRAG